MSRASKKKSSKTDLSSPRPERWLAFIFLGVGLCSLVGYLTWLLVGPSVLAGKDYHLDPKKIEITPPPTWIRADIRRQVIHEAGLDERRSILDDDLVQHIADAFEFHPWVAKVTHVSKSYPGRIRVEIDYRRPVLVVKLEGSSSLQILPVDIEGVHLPGEDFSTTELQRFPRLTGISHLPLVGQRAEDDRVRAAARLAALLEDDWNRMQLALIVPPNISEDEGADEYSLVTRGGSQIAWGRISSKISPSKLTAKEKLARLRHYFEEFKTLEGATGPQRLDVRRLGSG